MTEGQAIAKARSKAKGFGVPYIVGIRLPDERMNEDRAVWGTFRLGGQDELTAFRLGYHDVWKVYPDGEVSEVCGGAMVAARISTGVWPRFA